MPQCPACKAPDRFEEKAKFIHEALVELQIVLASADEPKILNMAYHSVIGLRAFVREQMINE